MASRGGNDEGPAKKRSKVEEKATTSKKTPANVASLKILSWNIAECIPSNDAPESFDAEEAIVREIILHKADVLCLQECPSSSWNPPELVKACYERVGSAQSHCGFVQLWVKSHIFYELLPSCPSPSVGAVFLIGSAAIPMGISSSHLAPYKQNASARFEQVKALSKAFAATSATTTIHAGDFNMRQAEDDGIEGFGLVDAWKKTGKLNNHKNTWNSIENKYHAEGYPFSCRFDRIYVSKGDNSKVTDFMLIAAKPLIRDEKKFYLSDHYGMLGTVQASKEE